MKIVGKVARDYYDCISSMGVDETQVLVRNPEELVLDNDNLKDYLKDCVMRFAGNVVYIQRIIFFCGELHYLTFKSGDEGKPLAEEEVSKLRDALPSCPWWRIKTELSSTTIKELEELSHKLKAPYFVIEADYGLNGYWINSVTCKTFPVLQDYSFQNIAAPYTAYQEIQQYYFGVLGGHNKELTDIEDKYKLEGKGFDSKYGFRTRPKEDK